MEKTFDTKYGTATIRSCMLELDDETTLVDGIEIRGEGIELDICGYRDVEELTIADVEKLIEGDY